MKDLFGVETENDAPKGKGRLAERDYKALLRINGNSPGNKCKDCVFFYRREFAGTYFKCEKAHQSKSTATDWRANWPACGLFQKEKLLINV